MAEEQGRPPWSCSGPVWFWDDLNPCLEEKYIHVLLPALAVTVSLLVLILCGIQISANRNPHHKAGYNPLLTEANGQVFPSYADEDDDDGDEDDDEDDTQPIIVGGRDSTSSEARLLSSTDEENLNGIMDGPTDSRFSTEQAVKSVAYEKTLVRPRFEHIRVFLEEILTAAMLAIHISEYITDADSSAPNYQDGSVVLIVYWSYCFFLVTLRLLFRNYPSYPFNSLWGHTSSLFIFYFFLDVVMFRTTLLYARSFQQLWYSTAEFIISFILFVNCIFVPIGNKPVVLKAHKGLQPSKEPISSIFSTSTFSWIDPLLWKGYHKTLDLQDVWDLVEPDYAYRVLDAFHTTRKFVGLSMTLISFFRRELIIASCWAFLYACFTFGSPLLLRQILEYVDDPEAKPKSMAWLYVILLFVAGLAESLANGRALYIGRRICIRIRAIIIGEIYAKALRRKEMGSIDSEKAAAKSEDQHGPESQQDHHKSDSNSDEDNDNENEKLKGQANVGAIINLMAVDAFRVSEICAYLHLFAGGIGMLVIALVLLYRLLGWSASAGVICMILLMPINYSFSKMFGKVRKEIMEATDKRIHVTNEVLQSIRIIKYFAWEERFAQEVLETRKVEMRKLRDSYIIWATYSAVWFGSPVIITLLTFGVYTMVAKQELTVPIAFTALSLFNIMRIPLESLSDMLTNVIQAKVSIDRVQEFLNEPETSKYEQLNHPTLDPSAPYIGFKKATFSWSLHPSNDFRIRDVDFGFDVGKLNIIVGPTGSGKTSMLMALLGEMNLISGSVYLPGVKSREDLVPDRFTGLTESVAYCAQQAWLLNDTIKNNILFASPLDENRYKEVVKACGLIRDLEILEGGDETEVGEKGITLSGGQKQRISVARALYSPARHVILDDCLSAVDAHTSSWIYDNCICGPLMQDRTCILVSHNVALTIANATKVVVMNNGRVAFVGTPSDAAAENVLGEDSAVLTSISNSAQVSRAASQANLTLHNEAYAAPSALAISERFDELTGVDDIPENSNGNNVPHPLTDEERKKAGKLVQEETRQEGRVSVSVYKSYLGAMGGVFFWFAVLAGFVGLQVGNIAQSWWIRSWAQGLTGHVKEAGQYAVYGDSRSVSASSSSGIAVSVGAYFINTLEYLFPSVGQGEEQTLQELTPNSQGIATTTNGSDVSAGAIAPATHSPTYYLIVYAIISLFYTLISMYREGIVFYGSLSASHKFFSKLLYRVLYAKMRFFDSTPIGRIMNRFSKDMEAIDQEVASIAIGLFGCILAAVSIVLVISFITPQFLVAGVFICLLFGWIGAFYLKSSRELKRLESVSKSPIYQHFGETLVGISTIRAYGDEKRFIRENLERIDANNRPFFFLWVCNRWLSIRVDLTGALVSFFSGFFILMNIDRLDSGLAGLSLTYAITFTENILWIVRLYAVTEMNMNSVERVEEFMDIEQEPEPIIEISRPPASWPDRGAICVRDLSLRYAPDLPLVIKHISFDVKPCSKIGIVGRTGAGKSTIITAFFRFLDSETGSIIIDGVDISKIGLRDLRQALAIIPQDPTLFTGTIRTNLDPFDNYTDDDIFEALRRVHLIDHVPTPQELEEYRRQDEEESDENKNRFLDLSNSVSEGGSNLSQGQRQLMCLARSLLKSPKVILLDEATASIDYDTDAKIQETIRQEFSNSTILTIAHRLRSIIDYDMIMVMDNGNIVEYDQPKILLDKKDSIFRDMCINSGDFDVLCELADNAQKQADPNKVSPTIYNH